MPKPNSIPWNIPNSQLLATGQELYFESPQGHEEICGLYASVMSGEYQPKTRPAAIYIEQLEYDDQPLRPALWIARCLEDEFQHLPLQIVRRPTTPMAWQGEIHLFRTPAELEETRKNMRNMWKRSVRLHTYIEPLLRKVVDEPFYETGLLPRPAEKSKSRAIRAWNKPDIQPSADVSAYHEYQTSAEIIPFPPRRQSKDSR